MSISRTENCAAIGTCRFRQGRNLWSGSGAPWHTFKPPQRQAVDFGLPLGINGKRNWRLIMSAQTTEYPRPEERERLERILLENLRLQEPELRKLLDEVNDHWGYEDGIYRFYHQSFKVYHLEHSTAGIIAALAGVAPEGRAFCGSFEQLTRTGTGREFTAEDNEHWVERTAPIVQAFLHAKFFLEMAVKYGVVFTEPPQILPSGWAAVLCLYRLR